MARRPPGRRTMTRTPETESEEKKPSGRRIAIITTVVLFAVIAISIVVGLYLSVWKDLWSPIIIVNDETINMDYVIRRMKYVEKTTDVLAMLETLTEEEFIRQGAGRYNIEVTPDEIDEILRDIARGENETISESEFKEWYRNALNETQLSDTEYRERLRTTLVAYELHEYLAVRVPTAAEQIRLYIIFLSSFEDTEAAITRIADGEDFSEVARELSIDEETAEQGGDAGWWPVGGGLPLNIEWVAFDLLEIGQVSDPILIDEEGQIYAICMVTERQFTREIEEDKLEIIKNGILTEWLYNEWDTVEYRWLGLDGGDFDTYTVQWISLQLLK